MTTQKISISYRRSRTRRLFIFQLLNKVATASTRRWHSELPRRRSSESCSASDRRKQCTFKHGRMWRGERPPPRPRVRCQGGGGGFLMFRGETSGLPQACACADPPPRPNIGVPPV